MQCMSDRPVHAGAELLVGPVGSRRQRGLGRTQVLEARARDGFPEEQHTHTYTHRKTHINMQKNSTQSSSRMTQQPERGEPALHLNCGCIIHMRRRRWVWELCGLREQLGARSASSTLG